MSWEIVGHGEAVEGLADADLDHVWRWELRDAMRQTFITVRFARGIDLMVDAGTIIQGPSTVAAHDMGRAEVEKMIARDELHRFVDVGRDGRCRWND